MCFKIKKYFLLPHLCPSPTAESLATALMLCDIMFQPVSHKNSSNGTVSESDNVYHFFPIIDKARLIPSTRKDAEAKALQALCNAPQARGSLQAILIKIS